MVDWARPLRSFVGRAAVCEGAGCLAASGRFPSCCSSKSKSNCLRCRPASPNESRAHCRAEACRTAGGRNNSGSRTAKIRHRVAKNAVNCRALAAREALLQCGEPPAHGLERWTNRSGGYDPIDADWSGRLLARKQDFMEPLARPDSNELNLDIATWLEAGQADHPFRKVDDFHRLPHIEHTPRHPNGRARARGWTPSRPDRRPPEWS